MLVWPASNSVAAVARMMKYITTLDSSMPMLTSQAAHFSSAVSRSAARPQRDATHLDVLLDLLIALPEEKGTARDGGSENGDQGRQERLVQRQCWHEGSAQHLARIRTGEQRSADVCQQCQRQPLERVRDQSIRPPDLQDDDGQRDWDDQHHTRDGQQQIDGRGDGAYICAGINGVGHEQAENAAYNSGQGKC